MRFTLDINVQIAMNGYCTIPATEDKRPAVPQWTPFYDAMMRGEYKFSAAFKGCRQDCGAAIMTGDKVAVVDGDSHGKDGSIPSLSILELLVATEPGLFDGCIIERTQSGGLHIYYQGIPFSKYPEGDSMWYEYVYASGRMYPMTEPIFLEVLRGKKLCYCFPTVTLKGAYTFEGRNTLLNTKRTDLPLLPYRFSDRFYKAVKEVMEDEEREPVVIAPGKLVREDFPVIIDHFMREDFSQKRHVGGWLFGKTIRGLEPWGYTVGRRELVRLVEEHITRRGRKLTDDHEAERIVEEVFDAPLEPVDEKYLPWKEIWAARARSAKGAVARMFRRGA
jgi:hypothetical protein